MTTRVHQTQAKRLQPSVLRPRALGVVLFAANLIVALASPVIAQKGGKTTEPPPAGTILFDDPVNAGTPEWYRESRAINADGTGKRLVFASRFVVRPVPSALVYGSDPVLHRWWLTFDEVVVEGATQTVYELFACRLNEGGILEQVQLTALYPDVTFAPSPLDTLLCWSNDGSDSFVSFRGRSYGTDTAETPAAERDLSDDRLHIYRLNFSGDEIQEAYELGIDPKFGLADLADGWIESVVETSDLAVNSTAPPLCYHHWSPDGSRLAYVMGDGLWVTGLTPNGSLVHEDLDSWKRIWTGCRHPQWSPNGQRIAFGDNGAVWTIHPDGSLPVNVATRTSSDAYAAPVWSPDGRHLVIWHKKLRSSLYPKYYVSRVPAEGGKVTVLATDNEPGEKVPMRWFVLEQ